VKAIELSGDRVLRQAGSEEQTPIPFRAHTRHKKNGTSVEALVPNLLGLPAAMEEPQLAVTTACGCLHHILLLTGASPVVRLSQYKDGRIIDDKWC
jgi:hypothetical protein